MSNVDVADDAIRWFLLRQSGEMTTADQRAFDGWMAEDPEASAAYHRVRRAWTVTERLTEDPAIGQSREIDARRYRSKSYRGAMVGAITALAASLVLAVMPTSLIPRLGNGSDDSSTGRQLSTGPNRRALVRLADGSAVTLDVDTRLRVMEMGERRRIILLAGHAFFRVVKDARHPFTVTADDKTVHAIGTAFDVRLNDGSVAVTLVEGKVRVDQPRTLLRNAKSLNLTPGRQLVANDNRPWTTAPVNTSSFWDRSTVIRRSLASSSAGISNLSRPCSRWTASLT